jgi:Flp pilus assembly protein TadB
MSDRVEHVSLDKVSVPVMLVIGGLFSLLMGAAYTFSEDISEHEKRIRTIELQTAQTELQAAQDKANYTATLNRISKNIEDLSKLQQRDADKHEQLEDRVTRLEIVAEQE